MSFIGRCAGTAVLMVIAGCASSTATMKDITVRTEPQPGAHFPKYGTFSWCPRPGDMPKDFKDSGAAEMRIREVLEREFTRRGFEYRAMGYKVNFFVFYRLVSEESIDAALLAKEAGQKPSGAPSEAKGKYVKGSLIVDVLHPDTHALMWRGAAEAKIEVATAVSEQEKMDRVGLAARRLLQEFPPK